MKRILTAILLTALIAALLAGCGAQTPTEPSESSETVPPSTSEPAETTAAVLTLSVKKVGNGNLAYAEKEEELEFNDEHPSMGMEINSRDPITYTFGAKPDPGSKFVEWTLDGKSYSKKTIITVTVSKSAELVAVFDNA